MRRERLLIWPEAVVRDSAEGMLARLSLYDAEDLFVLQRWRRPLTLLGQAGARALHAVAHLGMLAGASLLLVALPWALVCTALGTSGATLAASLWLAFGLTGLAGAGLALWRGRQRKRRRLDQSLQSAVLFQCLSRVLPYSPRRAGARLLASGDMLALEVGLRGGLRCCIQANAAGTQICASMHREEAPLDTLWVRELSAHEGDEPVVRAVLLADALSGELRRRVPRARGAGLAVVQGAPRPAGLQPQAPPPEKPWRARLLQRGPMAVREPRPMLLRRLGQVRLGSFWGVGGAVVGAYGGWLVPALLGATPASSELALSGVLGLGLVGLLWSQQPRAPRRRARRALVLLPPQQRQLLFDGRWLKLSDAPGGIDLDHRFTMHLTHFEDPLLGCLLGMELCQGRRSLRLCAVVERSQEVQALPALELDAPLVGDRDFSRWLWPMLLHRLACSGGELPQLCGGRLGWRSTKLISVSR